MIFSVLLLYRNNSCYIIRRRTWRWTSVLLLADGVREHLGQVGFGKALPELRLERAVDLRECRLDAAPDGTASARRRSVHAKERRSLDRIIDVQQRDRVRSLGKRPTRVRTAATLHQSSLLQRTEQATDHHRIGLYAVGDAVRGRRLPPSLLPQNHVRQDMDSNRHPAVGAHPRLLS